MIESENDSLVRNKLYKNNKINNEIDIFKTHLKATSFGFPDIENNNKTCKCCDLSLNNNKFNIFSSSDKFSINGCGYSLFFKFIGFLMIILIFPFSILAIFNINHNNSGNFCKNFKKNNISDTLDKLNKYSYNKEIKQIKYFMYFYCYTHFINKSSYCQEFYSKNCYSNYNQDCQIISIKNYEKNINKQKCDKSYYYRYSFINAINIPYNELYNMMNLFALFLMYLFIEKFINYFNNKVLFYDQEHLTNTDYSLKISKIPLKMDNFNNIKRFKNDLKNYLNKNIDKNIVNIYPVYHINSLINLKNKIKKLNDKITIIKYKNNLYNINKYNKIAKLKEKFSVLEGLYKTKWLNFFNCKKNYFSGICIVSFNYPKNLNKFIKLISTKKSICNFKTNLKNYNNLKINYITEPSDVIWGNLDVSLFTKLKRKFLSSLLLVFITFILFIFILYLKIKDINDDEDVELFENNVFISLIITIANYFIEEVTVNLGKFIKPKSKSHKYGLAIKSIYKFKFFIYSMISLLASIILFNFYGKNGLINSLNTLFLTEIVMAPLKEIIMNFGNIVILIKRYILKNCFDLYPMTENKLKKLFTKQRFEIEIYYSDSMKLISSALFYAPIFPPVIFYSLISLFINYCLYKYVLIERCNKNINYSSILTKKLINELEYLWLIFSLGIIVKEILESFISISPLNFSSSAIFCLFFSIFNIIVPIEELDSYFKEEIIVEENNLHHNQMLKNKSENYKNYNPYRIIKEDYKHILN